MFRSPQRFPKMPVVEEEFLLEPALQSTLHNGLQELPAPSARADFNARVLATLISGSDFAPWWRQIGARLRWMLLPAMLGFGTILILTFRQARALPALPSLTPPQGVAMNMPPLPALPKHLIPLQLPRRIKSAPAPWKPAAYRALDRPGAPHNHRGR